MNPETTDTAQAEPTGNSDKSRRLSLQEQKNLLEERHKKELAQLKAKIKAEEQREKIKDRKNDARRKIIAGALVLHHMDKNTSSEVHQVMTRLLNEYVVKDTERALFDLPPLSPDEQSQRLNRHAKERKKESAHADAGFEVQRYEK